MSLPLSLKGTTGTGRTHFQKTELPHTCNNNIIII